MKYCSHSGAKFWACRERSRNRILLLNLVYVVSGMYIILYLMSFSSLNPEQFDLIQLESTGGQEGVGQSGAAPRNGPDTLETAKVAQLSPWPNSWAAGAPTSHRCAGSASCNHRGCTAQGQHSKVQLVIIFSWSMKSFADFPGLKRVCLPVYPKYSKMDL